MRAAGTATPEQVARLRAAATLTPEQTTAVQQGKPATIDQGQYDYLNGLMRAQDGMSAAEMNKTLDKYPDLEGAMGRRVPDHGYPNIQAANGEHGGIGNEPNRIQALLNDDLKYQTGSRPGSVQAPMVPLSQFDALNDMPEHGNPDVRAGSDVDRALFERVSAHRAPGPPPCDRTRQIRAAGTALCRSPSPTLTTSTTRSTG